MPYAQGEDARQLALPRPVANERADHELAKMGRQTSARHADDTAFYGATNVPDQLWLAAATLA